MINPQMKIDFIVQNFQCPVVMAFCSSYVKILTRQVLSLTFYNHTYYPLT